MDPLAAWILLHGRNLWRDPATRASFEQLHGPITETRWRSALGQAYRQERAVNALEAAAPQTTVRNALWHIIATPRDVSIPLRITGHDAAGRVVNVLVFATLSPTDPMSMLWQQAAWFAQQAAIDYAITVANVSIAHGVQVL